MLDRAEDRDSVDEWLNSELQYVTVDRDLDDLQAALGLGRA